MFAKPQVEHQWLEKLVGSWEFEHACQMPDGTKSTTPGEMQCRMLGGLWLIMESSGQSDDGEPWSSIMTLGFDPAIDRYVGTFLGSMMANIWSYQGVLDSTNKRLPLDTQGPKFDGSGVCPYRDTIEWIESDRWLFTSQMQLDDGQWVQFMEGLHVRS